MCKGVKNCDLFFFGGGEYFEYNHHLSFFKCVFDVYSVDDIIFCELSLNKR